MKAPENYILIRPNTVCYIAILRKKSRSGSVYAHRLRVIHRPEKRDCIRRSHLGMKGRYIYGISTDHGAVFGEHAAADDPHVGKGSGRTR